MMTLSELKDWFLIRDHALRISISPRETILSVAMPGRGFGGLLFGEWRGATEIEAFNRAQADYEEVAEFACTINCESCKA